MNSTETKNKTKSSNALHYRQVYVPASVKVVEVFARRVLCTSTETLEEETFEW